MMIELPLIVFAVFLFDAFVIGFLIAVALER